MSEDLQTVTTESRHCPDCGGSLYDTGIDHRTCRVCEADFIVVGESEKMNGADAAEDARNKRKDW